MNTGYNKYNLEASFKKYLIAENISQDSIKNYLSDLRYFLGWSHSYLRKNGKMNDSSPDKKNIDINVVLVAELTTELIEAFKRDMVQTSLPRQSINRRLSTIRKFGQMCVFNKWVHHNPGSFIKSVSSKKSIAVDHSLIFAHYAEHLTILNKHPDDIKTILRDLKELLYS